MPGKKCYERSSSRKKILYVRNLGLRRERERSRDEMRETLLLHWPSAGLRELGVTVPVVLAGKPSSW